LFILSTYQFYEPITFGALLNEGYSYTANNWQYRARLSSSFIDSNTYAGALIVFIIFIWELRLKKNKIILFLPFLLVTSILIFYSGSREGLLLLTILYIKILFDKTNGKNFWFILFGSIAIVSFIILNLPQLIGLLYDTGGLNIFQRIVGANISDSYGSNYSRISSIFDALNFLKNNYFIFGPGILFWKSSWASYGLIIYPHNNIIYIMAQYGMIGGTIFIYYIIMIFRLSIKNRTFILFIIFLIQLFLLPNFIYYPISFLIINYISLKTYHEKNTNCCNS
jgi:hypothetical protein